MKCEYCELLELHKNIIYEDKEVVVAVREMASSLGEVTIFSREHMTILELVPQDILAKCSVMANKAGVAVFEALGVQGTNVLIRNGLGAEQKVPHFSIAVIPRKENDGLNLHWDPQPAEESDIEATLSLLKEEAASVKEEKEEQQEERAVRKQKEQRVSSDNPMLQSLRKIP